MIAPLLRLAAEALAGRSLRETAGEFGGRLLLVAVAGIGAVVCFSQAALTLMERHMDPAEAWAVLGGLYSVTGGILYLAAIRRRD